MKYLALSLLLCSAAHAGEVELACNLERSKAEVRASTLTAPSAFGSIGQDAASGTKSVIAGVSQSLSGRLQASKIRQAAEARCDSIRSILALEEHGRWSLSMIERDSTRAELRVVEKAILLAKENIAQLDAELAAQVITISQHTEARQVLVSLENQQVRLLRILSSIVLPPPEQNIASVLDSARRFEGSAARLSAEASAETGWDVVLSAGVRQPFDSSKAAGFGTIALKYSFGYEASKIAARNVGTQTIELLAAQQGGFTQTVLRQQKELQSLIDSETLAVSAGTRQLTHLSRVRSSIVGIGTALAQNTLRSMELQLLSLEAGIAGAQVRLDGYKVLLGKIS